MTEQTSTILDFIPDAQKRFEQILKHIRDPLDYGDPYSLKTDDENFKHCPYVKSIIQSLFTEFENYMELAYNYTNRRNELGPKRLEALENFSKTGKFRVRASDIVSAKEILARFIETVKEKGTITQDEKDEEFSYNLVNREGLRTYQGIDFGLCGLIWNVFNRLDLESLSDLDEIVIHLFKLSRLDEIYPSDSYWIAGRQEYNETSDCLWAELEDAETQSEYARRLDFLEKFIDFLDEVLEANDE